MQAKTANLAARIASTQPKVDMVATLAKAQTNTDAELKRIGDSLIYASQQLSTSGISGIKADEILNALAANSSYIINAATET